MSLEQHKIPEKTCPECGCYVARRQHGTYCPFCSSALFTYRMGRGKNAYTIWVTDEHRVKDIVIQVLEYIQKLPGKEDYQWTSIGHYKQQLGSASLLLRICEGNQALALEVVDILYDSKRRLKLGVYGHRPLSVSAIISKHASDKLALAIVEAKRATEYFRADPKTSVTQEPM